MCIKKNVKKNIRGLIRNGLFLANDFQAQFMFTGLCEIPNNR